MCRIGLPLLLHFEVSYRTCSTSDSTGDKYHTDWFRISDLGAPGYITSTLLNGMSFVNGWEQNFFVSKWSMHQLVMIQFGYTSCLFDLFWRLADIIFLSFLLFSSAY